MTLVHIKSTDIYLQNKKDSNEKENKISHKFMRIHKKLLGIHPTFPVFCYRTVKRNIFTSTVLKMLHKN